MKSGKGFESTGGAYKSQVLNDDSVKTAETHCRNVEHAITLCRERISQYGEIVKELQQEINFANKSVKESETYARKEVEPIVKNILNLLEQRKIIQLNVNKKMESQIIQLKKEKAELVQNILQCKKKVDELQKDLGRYPGDKSIKTKLQTKTLTGQF